ncbi:hypothetical protein CLIB1423_05S00100 [[Candida] railenensis]|uniref:Zn(2)-C6 fungal-type domain-containing protein n=1 Tax=[Candida] railenensis TaxID=45579 RepID=A0A9P0QNL8_9ASCO|nr:hypothetical protein CLIB1423_05S00100 [[Candida] railenensis]
MSLPPISDFITGAFGSDRSSPDKIPTLIRSSNQISGSVSKEARFLAKIPLSSSSKATKGTTKSKSQLENRSHTRQASSDNKQVANIISEYQYHQASVQCQHHRHAPSFSTPNQMTINASNYQIFLNPSQMEQQQFHWSQGGTNGFYQSQNGTYWNMVQGAPLFNMSLQNGQGRSAIHYIGRYQLLLVDLSNTFELNNQLSHGVIPVRQPDVVTNPKVIRKRRKLSTRSRTGCLTCKRRKVKCDEGGLICHNCRKSSRICEWFESI